MLGYEEIGPRDYAGGAEVATHQDVERAWAGFTELNAAAAPAVLDFLEERGLDWRVGRELGFRWAVIGGRVMLGFHAGQGIKVRSVVRDDSRDNNPWHREVLPKELRKEWAGVTLRARGSDRVVVFESETDMWAFAQHVPDCDVAFLPAGASKWDESWASPLRRYQQVYIATDADEKGDDVAQKIALDLGDAKRLRPEGYKDWCEALAAGAAVSFDTAEDALTLQRPKPPADAADERFVDMLAVRAQEIFGWDLDHPYLHEWVSRQTNWPSVAVQERFSPTKSLWECEYNGATIEELEIDRDELWIIDGVLPTGTITTFAGRSKGGKSRLAMEAARAVTTGGKFLGEYQAHEHHVLFLCGDDDDRALQVLFQDWMRAHEIPNDRLTVLMNPELNLLSVVGLKSFRKYLEEYQNRCAAVPLLVLDSLYNFTPSLDDNERGPVKKVLGDIIRLAHDGLVKAVLVIDHAAKSADSANGADAVIGSQAKGGMSRSGINVTKGDSKSGDDGTRILEDGSLVLETKLIRWGNAGAGWSDLYHHDPVKFTWTRVIPEDPNDVWQQAAEAALSMAEGQTLPLRDLARQIGLTDLANVHKPGRGFRRALELRPDLFLLHRANESATTSPWLVTLTKRDQPSF